ncbi:CCD81 protein, partial [Turnix velox]|nr:CCD81 protein [Turnix velox]
QGVELPGLGTFAPLQEEFVGEKEVIVARRPIFRMGVDKECQQKFLITTDIIPESIPIRQLNYKWLARAASLPLYMVTDCVKETILLYTLQIKNDQELPFIFKDLGVLTCRNGVLCMRFYYKCVTRLETKATRIALMRT